MFCERCGKELAPAAKFCGDCGKPVGASAAAPAPDGRVNRHLTLLGILWLVAAGLRALALVWVFTVGRIVVPYVLSWIPGEPMGFPLGRFIHGMVGLGLVIGCALVLLGFLAGWGLLQREPWGRTIAIIAAILALIRIPFGTALGIYTLWVLMPNASDEEYRHLARAT